MKTTAVHKSTPPSVKGESKPAVGSAKVRRDFMSAALNMSWQLAIVVLVPVVGGYKLDEHFGTAPALTIIGFIVAMIAMTIVMWRQMQRFSPKITQADIENAKRLRDQEDDD